MPSEQIKNFRMILYNIPFVNAANDNARPNSANIRYNSALFFGNTIMSEPLLSEKLNLETARMPWQESQTHFARGAAVYVGSGLDLIAVAKMMAEDDSATLGALMQQGRFGLVSEAQARQFLADNQEMWTVVVAPWVLVQPCAD